MIINQAETDSFRRFHPTMKLRSRSPGSRSVSPGPAPRSAARRIRAIERGNAKSPAAKSPVAKAPAAHFVSPGPAPRSAARRIRALERVSATSAKEKGGASVSESTFNLVKNVVGAGVLSLPSGVAAGTGLVPAIALALLLGVFSACTFALLGRLCESTSARSFSRLGEATLGPRFGRLLAATCTAKTFFTCLAYSLVLSDAVVAILAAGGAPASLARRAPVLIGLSTLVLYPLCARADLSRLASISLIGSCAMLYAIAFMALRCVDGSYAPGGRFFVSLPAHLRPAFDASRTAWTITPQTLVLACGLSTAFMAHYNAPAYYAGLERHSVPRFNVVVGRSFGAASGIFVAAMTIGYVTFGTASQGLILNNYSTDDTLATSVRIALAASIACTYPLAFTGLRDGVLSLAETEHATSLERRRLNVALLGAITVLALLVDDVGFVNALGGSIFGAVLIYVYPAALFLLAERQPAGRGRRRAPRAASASQLEVRLAQATVGFGVLLSIVGSLVTVTQRYNSL